MKNLLINFLAMQSLRSNLLYNKGKSYGPFLLSSSPNIAELLAGIGYSHIVVDMEHAPNDISTTLSMLRAIDSTARGKCSVQNDNFPIVRVPSHNDVAMTKQILDILRPPAGIMFPMIETAQQAEAAIASTRYAPHYKNGIRGCAYPFVRASEYGKNTEYFHVDSNQELLSIVQVETKKGIDNIPDIGMVDGVDVIFLGPFDISCDINQMGQFEPDGDVVQLVRHAEQLVRETRQKKREQKGIDVCLGGFRVPGRSLEEMFSEDVGYQFVSGSIDLGLLKDAALSDYQAGQDAITHPTNKRQ